MNLYILKEGVPVSEPDIATWGLFMEDTSARRVGDDRIGEVRVSTVFLGVDHGYGSPMPILWETMIFGGEHDQWCERYSTKEQAEAGHQRAIRIARGEEDPE